MFSDAVGQNGGGYPELFVLFAIFDGAICKLSLRLQGASVFSLCLFLRAEARVNVNDLSLGEVTGYLAAYVAS